MARSLSQLLDDISVIPPGQWNNTEGPEGWYAVCDNKGIIAYFGKGSDAYRFRLSEINRRLNP
jgi:hypothetical protein